MKIEKILVKKINISPVWTPVICRIYTDTGLYGDGEAGMAYGMGATGAYGMVIDYARQIIGMDAMEHEIIWEKLYRSTFWGKAGGAAIYSGLSALDMALWDIKGKQFQVPVYTLLGGKRRDRLRCYASQLQYGWGENYEALGPAEEYAKCAGKAVEEGYDAVKVDLFTFDRDRRALKKEELMGLLSPYYTKLFEERLSAIRETVGDSVDIIIENHANTDANSAVQIGKISEKYGVFLFEEPCVPNVKMTKYIGEKLDIPIAQGERLFTRWQYAPFFEANALQVIQPDIGTCGGMTEAKKICDMALIYDVGVQAHLCASPLSTAAALHLESAIPNFVIHEHHRNSLYPHNRKLCTVDIQPKNGYLSVGEAPGWGCEFTEETLARKDSLTEIIQHC